ncbi:MAG: hypothetical protein ACLR4Z_01535 [Butyricicoccaceae bacterium]
MPASSTAVLGYDTESGRWIYQTDLAYDTGENVPEKQKAIQIANDFISNLYPVETLGNPTAIADMSGRKEQAFICCSMECFLSSDGGKSACLWRISYLYCSWS